MDDSQLSFVELPYNFIRDSIVVLKTLKHFEQTV